MRDPALMMIQMIINDHISQHVGPRLLWNRTGKAMDMYFVPKNLLGAIWLQFSKALIRSKKLSTMRDLQQSDGNIDRPAFAEPESSQSFPSLSAW